MIKTINTEKKMAKVRILVANSTGAKGASKQVAVTPVKAVEWVGCFCWAQS